MIESLECANMAILRPMQDGQRWYHPFSDIWDLILSFILRCVEVKQIETHGWMNERKERLSSVCELLKQKTRTRVLYTKSTPCRLWKGSKFGPKCIHQFIWNKIISNLSLCFLKGTTRNTLVCATICFCFEHTREKLLSVYFRWGFLSPCFSLPFFPPFCLMLSF